MAAGPNYKDYYKQLGITKTATEKEIKTAYRKLARKYHPDVNPNDKSAEDKFKEVQEAYDVLADTDKRSKYDRYGDEWKAYSQAEAAGFGGQQGQGFPGGFPGGGGGYRVEYGGDPGQGADLNDLFASLFGGQGGRGGFGGGGASPFGNMRNVPQRGQDVEAGVTITLEEAFNGAEKSFTLSGEPRFDVNRNGYTESGGRRVDVKIPAGVSEGQKIRLAGQGGNGPAGSGDLFLVVSIAPNAMFERKGDDIYTDVPVPYTDASLGGEVKVPNLKGQRLTMRIPAGVQSGQTLRLGGQGMPKLKSGGGFGDLYARIKITVPKTLSARERELLTELQELSARTA